LGRSFCWRRIHHTDVFTADPVWTEISAKLTYNETHFGPWDHYPIVVRRFTRSRNDCSRTTRAKEAEQWREASVSTEVDAKRPLPDIRF
jgi:hypothetical protein